MRFERGSLRGRGVYSRDMGRAKSWKGGGGSCLAEEREQELEERCALEAPRRTVRRQRRRARREGRGGGGLALGKAHEEGGADVGVPGRVRLVRGERRSVST